MLLPGSRRWKGSAANAGVKILSFSIPARPAVPNAARGSRRATTSIFGTEARGKDERRNVGISGWVDCGRVPGGVVVYLAVEPEKIPMSLWVYFVHGLLLGLFLAWFASLFGKKQR